MVQGFSGFGFPKAHGAAFGLLAYQSTWLRVHYGPEFLCSLLNEQPMGFYPPDALVHEAQRRGIEVLSRRTSTRAGPSASSTRTGACGSASATSVACAQQEVRRLVGARNAGGRFRSLADLASRAGLERSLARAARLVRSVRFARHSRGTLRDRQRIRVGRLVLWQLGVATPGHNVPGGTQLALPLDLPAPPKLRELSRVGLDARRLRDHRADRPRPSDGAAARADAGRRGHEPRSRALQHGSRVRIGGLVVARQRPGTANGIVFILLEDEFGTINLIVPPQVYERHRLTVRTEPLMLVEGKLERFAAAGGAINVLVDQIGSIAAPERPLAEIKDFSMLDEQVRRGLAEQRRDEAREARWPRRPRPRTSAPSPRR